MLVVRTRLDRSRIHGLGVMAVDPIGAGDLIWRFAPGVDLLIGQAEVETMPAAFRSYLDTYGYEAPEFPGYFVLSCDHAKFLNHADTPNTVIRGRETFARCDIGAGEEITCDYRIVVAGFTGF